MNDKEIRKFVDQFSDDGNTLAKLMLDVLSKALEEGAVEVETADGGPMEDGGFVLFMKVKQTQQEFDLDAVLKNAAPSKSQ